jgi:predicted nuclease of predicted toxin-antitoxin system
VTAGRPVLRLFLDEGVPDSVGHVFMAEGHEVGFLNKSPAARGSADPVVAMMADINNAILVALDGDMKRLAQGYGIGARNYLKLGLIKRKRLLEPTYRAVC